MTDGILSAHSWQLEHVDARGEHYSCSCGETIVVAPDDSTEVDKGGE